MKTKKKLIYIVSFHSALILITASTCMDGLPKQSPSYYEILQIENSASQEVVKNAYRILEEEHKQEIAQTTDIRQLKTLKEKKQKIDIAYSILSNEETRIVYDQDGKKGIKNFKEFCMHQVQKNRKQQCQNRNFIRSNQPKILKNLNNTLHLSEKEQACSEICTEYVKVLNKTNSNFKSELKFYITQICTKLAKILYSKGLYKNALYWIDFATKNYLPQDPQFTKLLQLKSRSFFINSCQCGFAPCVRNRNILA